MVRLMRGHKNPGVYVPPPTRREETVAERTARLKARTTPKGFLDAQPVAPRTDLAEILAHKTEDWKRREQHHLNKLGEMLGGMGHIYQVRSYIQEEAFYVAGDWVEGYEEDGITHPGYWTFCPISHAIEWPQMVDEARKHIIEVFRTVLGDTVCPHGEPWEDWKPRPNSKSGSAGCERCRLDYELRMKGRDPNLANFPDAKLVAGNNTLSANMVLATLGLSLRAGQPPHTMTASPEKLNLIEAAITRTALIGGKKGSQGLGPDSSDKAQDDKSAGSQSNSKTGNVDANLPGDNKIDNRKYESLPKFDAAIPIETHDDAEPLKDQIALPETKEEEEGSEDKEV
jgi:hypothetical protein